MIIDIQVLKDIVEYAETVEAETTVISQPSITSVGYTVVAELALRSQPEVEKLKTLRKTHQSMTVEIEPVELTIDLKNSQPRLSIKIKVEKK